MKIFKEIVNANFLIIKIIFNDNVYLISMLFYFNNVGIYSVYAPFSYSHANKPLFMNLIYILMLFTHL